MIYRTLLQNVLRTLVQIEHAQWKRQTQEEKNTGSPTHQKDEETRSSTHRPKTRQNGTARRALFHTFSPKAWQRNGGGLDEKPGRRSRDFTES